MKLQDGGCQPFFTFSFYKTTTFFHRNTAQTIPEVRSHLHPPAAVAARTVAADTSAAAPREQSRSHCLGEEQSRSHRLGEEQSRSHRLG